MGVECKWVDFTTHSTIWMYQQSQFVHHLILHAIVIHIPLYNIIEEWFNKEMLNLCPYVLTSVPKLPVYLNETVSCRCAQGPVWQLSRPCCLPHTHTHIDAYHTHTLHPTAISLSRSVPPPVLPHTLWLSYLGIYSLWGYQSSPGSHHEGYSVNLLLLQLAGPGLSR